MMKRIYILPGLLILTACTGAPTPPTPPSVPLPPQYYDATGRWDVTFINESGQIYAREYVSVQVSSTSQANDYRTVVAFKDEAVIDNPGKLTVASGNTKTGDTYWLISKMAGTTDSYSCTGRFDTIANTYGGSCDHYFLFKHSKADISGKRR